MNERDRRRAVRTPYRGFASVSWDTGYATCEIIDLGPGGLRAQRPEPCPRLGVQVFVEFELPGHEDTVEVHARVVHLDQGAMGLTFDDLSGHVEQCVVDFVHDHGWLL